VKIRWKMVFVALPLIVAPLLVTGFISSLAARNGITQVATGFLRFKMDDLLNYANSQWALLVENKLGGNEEFLAATRAAVISFARSLIRGESELIFAVDLQGTVTLATGAVNLSSEEAQALGRLREKGFSGWTQLRVGGVERVAQTAAFEPFGWYLLVTEKRATFYQITSQIFWQTGLILSISLAVAVVLLMFFSFYLTQPLRLIATAMREIIATGDLSKRVEVLYRDETGELGHSFNLMVTELDKAYQEIKGYAFKAAVAHHKEQKIRNIFQKYVPKTVIDQFFSNPEAMLVGQERILALLFSDVRGFTTITENMLPEEVVESLNTYFGMMVEIIFKRNGIVDKFIGDALMAFFGAPVRYRDEPMQAVLSAFEMLEALKSFNAWQARRNRPAFKIGIGINYGVVTVGNIGSERKMDYTVIGDMVNVASRLEGLTKVYREELIVSESVVKYLEGKFPCRQLDRVVVKGRTSGIGIYVPRQELSAEEREAWELHSQALKHYYSRGFGAAAQSFQQVLRILPQDRTAAMFLERCRSFQKSPPPAEWTGAEVMLAK
jgi:class 3 adenylate cyclase/HAMP domain-containing protein